MDTNLVSYALWTNVYQWATAHGYSFGDAGSGKAANHPVQTVEWYDVVKWCNARSQQAHLAPVYYTDAGFTQVYSNSSGLHTNLGKWKYDPAEPNLALQHAWMFDYHGSLVRTTAWYLDVRRSSGGMKLCCPDNDDPFYRVASASMRGP